MSRSDNNRGSLVDTLFYEPITFGVTVYLGLFALLVFGGIAIYVGYRTFGFMLICGSVATIAALIFRVLPWFAEPAPAMLRHGEQEPLHSPRVELAVRIAARFRLDT